jgi:glycosyltransferase involved in cell wall biosynthesis
MNHIAVPLRSASGAARRPIVADMSLALINRTGAYHVCREVAESCADLLAGTIHWRHRGESPPEGIIRRILGRIMLQEIAHPRLGRLLPRRRRPGEAMLFMDPLYVMAEAPERGDTVLCHDLGPVSHPELFGPETEAAYRRAYRLIQAGRPGMVFVSEASRDAFIGAYGHDFRFLEVIPLFVRPLRSGTDAEPPPGVTSPFLLTVAALERRKNHLRCFEAFAASGLAQRGFRYVVCGPRGNAAGEVTEAAAATPGVVHLGYVSDAQLRWLYRNAAGFVLPSLLEGFGMPALEAAQHGLVSLVGQGGAQREAVGEGAIFVDETSVDDIRAGLLRLADMPASDRAALVALARAHAQALSRERFIGAWRALLTRESGKAALQAE